jgi:hypothetical protein
MSFLSTSCKIFHFSFLAMSKNQFLAMSFLAMYGHRARASEPKHHFDRKKSFDRKRILPKGRLTGKKWKRVIWPKLFSINGHSTERLFDRKLFSIIILNLVSFPHTSVFRTNSLLYGVWWCPEGICGRHLPVGTFARRDICPKGHFPGCGEMSLR